MRSHVVSFGNRFPARLHCVTCRLTKMKNLPEDYSHYSRCIAATDSDLSGTRVPMASRRRQKDPVPPFDAWIFCVRSRIPSSAVPFVNSAFVGRRKGFLSDWKVSRYSKTKYSLLVKLKKMLVKLLQEIEYSVINILTDCGSFCICTV